MCTLNILSSEHYKKHTNAYGLGSASLAVAVLAIAVAGVFIAQALVKSGTLPGKLHLFKFVTDLDWKIAAYIAGGVGAGAIAFGAGAAVGFAKSRIPTAIEKAKERLASIPQPATEETADISAYASLLTQYAHEVDKDQLMRHEDAIVILQLIDKAAEKHNLIWVINTSSGLGMYTWREPRAKSDS